MAALVNEEMDFEEILDAIMWKDENNVDRIPPQDNNPEEVEGADQGDEGDQEVDEDEGLGEELLPTRMEVIRKMPAGTAEDGLQRIYCTWGSFTTIIIQDGELAVCAECYQHYRYKILSSWRHKHTLRHRSGLMRELPHRTECATCRRNLYIVTPQDACYYCLTNIF